MCGSQEKAARNKGIDTKKPFPFIIKGEFTNLDWHIISPQISGGSHDEHLANSWKEKAENVNGKILGFYSKSHQGIFTHHTSNIHMHYYDETKILSGHVDYLVSGTDCKLALPNL